MSELILDGKSKCADLSPFNPGRSPPPPPSPPRPPPPLSSPSPPPLLLVLVLLPFPALMSEQVLQEILRLLRPTRTAAGRRARGGAVVAELV
eukprot:454086-Hanusia_phi.AAC.1